jgi:SAM-dependent methyltransferase
LYDDGRHYDLQQEGFTTDIPFYADQVAEHGDPVLELACGTGRLAIPLAARGWRVTGLDISAPMLQRAREKAREQGVEVRWIEGDCRDFDLGERFGCIILAFNALSHLHELEEIDGCFSCVRRHLLPRGRFILVTFNPRLEILLRDPDERFPVCEYPDPDGRGRVVVTESNRYDRATQVNRIRWHYAVGGVEESVRELNMRIFFPQELDALLKHNGLVITAKYGDVDGSPFSSDSPQQLVVCARA